MEQKFQEYAQLLVEVGLNVQKGQDLVIACPVEAAWFARLCAKAAYAVGCREVVMNWRDDNLTRQKFLNAADDVFDAMPAWESEFYNSYAKKGAAYLSIYASDPENLKGVDSDRIVRNQKSSSAGMKEYRRLQMANGYPWCVASIPIPAWATKVFPDCSVEEAMNKTWEAIFAATRVSGNGDAVELWRKHVETLQERKQKLNDLKLESLHYTNSLGTDLVIRLHEDHYWTSAGSRTPNDQLFIANMPTEEIYTAPLRDGIDGVVYAALPLVYGGNIINNFHFVIKEGKIVEAHAEVGEEHLKGAITMDEGASYFGEVALVPYDSPISNQKILFYNTLFDENASCHLAFGKGYSQCIKGGEKMSEEELKEKGLNMSIAHVDFMLGTADLNIMGKTRDGKEVPIFVNGNFAI